MKTIMAILSVLIVAPIWFYLLYCILVRVEASELMWFLFWIYIPVAVMVAVMRELIKESYK